MTWLILPGHLFSAITGLRASWRVASSPSQQPWVGKEGASPEQVTPKGAQAGEEQVPRARGECDVSAAPSQGPTGKQQVMESEQAGTGLIWQVFKEGCWHWETIDNVFPEL